MRSPFGPLGFVVLALAGTLARAQSFHVNDLPEIHYGQPALISWTGGVRPYYVTVLKTGGSGASSILKTLLNFGNQTSVSWTVDLPVREVVTVSVLDSTGVYMYSNSGSIMRPVYESSSSSVSLFFSKAPPVEAVPTSPIVVTPAAPAASSSDILNTLSEPSVLAAGASSPTSSSASSRSVQASPSSGSLSSSASPVTSASDTALGAAAAKDDSATPGLSGGSIGGIVGGVLAGLAVAVAIAFYFFLRRRRAQRSSAPASWLIDDDDNASSDLPTTAVNPFATPAAAAPPPDTQTYFSTSHPAGPKAETAYTDSSFAATAAAHPASSVASATSPVSGVSAVSTGFSTGPATATSFGADARPVKAAELSVDPHAHEREVILVEVDDGPAPEHAGASTVRLPPAYNQTWSASRSP